jgi:mRNA-degrading endonuclease RelE of RelBE toxin-antitoxin system
MPWQIAITRKAGRAIAALPERDQTAILDAIERLAASPGAVDLKKLGGRRGRWRLRVGRWRAILAFDNDAGVITVTEVLSRDRAYRE